nr:hypothetical protein [Tanacetum cinerariifolium]
MRQLIREECSMNVCEEQKQNMEKTMLELVEICHHKQFLCMHDNVDDLIESAFDSKLLLINLINSQHLGKKEQEVKNVEEQPAERRNHAETSLQNFRVIHKSSISLKDTSQISSVHAEKLFSAAMNDISDNSSNDPLLEEVNLFLASNHSIPPGIENFYDPEGDIRFLKALLIDDFIPFSVNESFDFENDPSIPRPPSKPPDEETNPEVISAVMENIDEPNESFDPGGEIFVSTNDEDVDYFPFMFVIRIFLPYLIHPEIS